MFFLNTLILGTHDKKCERGESSAFAEHVCMCVFMSTHVQCGLYVWYMC